jgi:hypothetical protein
MYVWPLDDFDFCENKELVRMYYMCGEVNI